MGIPRRTSTMAKESTPLVIDASETSSIGHGDVHRPRRRRSAMTSVAAVGVISMVLGIVLILAGGRLSDEHARVGGILNWVFRGRVRPEVTFTLDASWIDQDLRAANPDFFTSPILRRLHSASQLQIPLVLSEEEHGKDDANRSAKMDGDDERRELRIWFRFGQRGRRDTP